MPIKDETGKQHGLWTVIARDGTRNGMATWKAVCSCGKQKSIVGASLRSGASYHCGHERIAKMIKANQIRAGTVEPNMPQERTAQRRLFKDYAARARKFKRVFKLSFEHFLHITSQPCFYCHAVPAQKYTYKHKSVYTYNGIDRIDNSKGYTIKNSVACCIRCNKSKSSTNDFLQWVKTIYEIHFQ